MHLMLAGFIDWIIVPGNWLTIITVVFGIGAVIFVHELGHFLVAKACGVRCDKFFVGFDIGGYKISKVWGETEYGIGILPLGGYVKMLGQDDNPARAAEEMQKAKLRAEEADVDPNDSEAAATAQHDQELLDPRSYQAKSVPQRMAIISAGVVMNVIFAFIFAMIAYAMGVPYTPCELDNIVPGDPAYNAGQHPGIAYNELNGLKNPSYREIRTTIGPGRGADIDIKAEQDGKEQEFVVTPEKVGKFYKIGVQPTSSLFFFQKSFVGKNTSAGNLKEGEGFEGLDEIIKVTTTGENPKAYDINDYQDLKRVQYEHRSETLIYTVIRREDKKPFFLTGETPAEREAGKKVDVTVPPNPMKTIGLEMKIGKIVAIQANSPAASSELKIGDQMVSINGQSLSEINPLSLHDLFWKLAREEGEPSVTIKVKRESQTEPVSIEIKPRKADWYTPARLPKTPGDIPALGLAYEVSNVIQKIEPNSPAAKTEYKEETDSPLKLKVGDLVTQAKIILDKSQYSDELWAKMEKKKLTEPIVSFDEENFNWPYLMASIQDFRLNEKMILTVKRGDKEIEFEIEPEKSTTQFNPERGLNLLPIIKLRVAESFGEAVSLAARETWGALTMVVRVLGSIDRLHGELGGPWGIAKGAGQSAQQGFSTFLIFLTMLSANLAIVNFLPIPILDGGHMVFLTLEGIFRKPVSEKVFVVAQFIGLALILSLMVYVIGLDIFREPN